LKYELNIELDVDNDDPDVNRIDLIGRTAEGEVATAWHFLSGGIVGPRPPAGYSGEPRELPPIPPGKYELIAEFDVNDEQLDLIKLDLITRTAQGEEVSPLFQMPDDWDEPD
jgi:hypothetical protein